MTTISAGTFCLNPLELDYPIIEIIHNMLNFATQVIVVDAGSTDGTVEKLKKIDARVEVYYSPWPRKFKRWSPTNQTEAVQRNKVLEKCKGDWVFFFDADEIIHENYHSIIKQYVCDVRYDMYDIPMIHLYRCKRDNKIEICRKVLGHTGIKSRPMLYRNHKGLYYGQLRRSSPCMHEELIGEGKSRNRAKRILQVYSPTEDEINVLHYGQCRWGKCVAKSLNLWGARYTQQDVFNKFDETKDLLPDLGYPLFLDSHPQSIEGWIVDHTKERL